MEGVKPTPFSIFSVTYLARGSRLWEYRLITEWFTERVKEKVKGAVEGMERMGIVPFLTPMCEVKVSCQVNQDVFQHP